jgi:calcium-independent phospholipase A2-gamma
MVDHGIAKNNPTKDLYYECRKLYSYANDIMVIISIGTGGNNGAPSTEQRRTEALAHPEDVKEMVRSVAERSAEATLAGEKFESDQRRLIEGDPPWMRYFRFEVPGLADLPLEEGLCVEEIKDRTTAYLAQEEVGRKFYAAVEAVVGVLVGRGAVHSPDGGWAVGS